MLETQVPSLGWENPLEEGMATHSSILAWRIPWTEEPGELQSMGSQRVGLDWASKYSTQHIPICRSYACTPHQSYSSALYSSAKHSGEDPAILWDSLGSFPLSCRLNSESFPCLVISKPSLRMKASAGFCLDPLLEPWPWIPLSCSRCTLTVLISFIPIFLEPLLSILWNSVSWRPSFYLSCC